MASIMMVPTLGSFSTSKIIREPRRHSNCNGRCSVITMKIEKLFEELYNIRVERQVSKERLAELTVSRWAVWKTGKYQLLWDWHVDQLVYIEECEVRVVPDGSERHMQFVTGNLIRYHKWFEADLWFNAPYPRALLFQSLR